jgi:signal transduction histidine kinase
MINPLTGIRGRVTFAVLAVSAIVYSVLGTVGFLQIAHRGHDTIVQRIDHVLDDLERAVQGHTGVLNIDTADGVSAAAYPVSSVPTPTRGEVVVTRHIHVDGADLVLQGHSSQVPLTESLRSLFRGLWLAIPAAASISALLAGLATHRALRPVGAITSFAAGIRGSPDGARVPVPTSGDEIERLAATVNQMLARIDEGRRAQRRFTSDAAHELRTPLMALRGEIELAERGDELDPSTASRLTAHSARLQDRIDDLVFLSTLDEARPLRLVPVDMLELTREEVVAVQPSTPVSGLETTVLADKTMVARAIRNLVANAHRHAHSEVRVSVENAADTVWVHVDDDGDGIDPLRRDEVFDRFSRLDDARRSDDGGSGLGLAIVASVAAAHGGGTAATVSSLGGARVSIWLPVVRA